MDTQSDRTRAGKDRAEAAADRETAAKGDDESVS
jgi:hypothetical protein